MLNNLFYSIMPLDEEHLEEICQDVAYQYKQGIASLALFFIKLVPEGQPVIDKAKIQCEKYKKFSDKLNGLGLKCGVLVQCTIGHGYPLDSFAEYQRYVNLTDGVATNTYCPYDEKLQEYFRAQFETIASYNPEVIMVDDDFRLLGRPGKGCCCPKHLKAFNDIAGTSFNREQLFKVLSDEENVNKEYRDIFIKIQNDALLACARAMREGIDKVNAKIQGMFCVNGALDNGEEIEKILAGEGNPTVIRVNCGFYCTEGARGLAWVMDRAQRAKLNYNADYYLTEADTCPQNRYSTSAHNLHAHSVASILEGVFGAKRWLTRLASFEPDSGIAYRKILSKYSEFYKKLIQIVPTLSWRGFRIPVQKNVFSATIKKDYNGFASRVFDRFGLPFYFSNEKGGVVCVDNYCDGVFSDEDVRGWLTQTAVLSSGATQNINDRGFGEYTGVTVNDWDGANPSGEYVNLTGTVCSAQKSIKELQMKSEKTEELSFVYHLEKGTERRRIFSGLTKFTNDIGGTVYSFCGSPFTTFEYTTAFSFLNESRKKQFVRILKDADELPVYYPEDAEILLKVADMRDGAYFVSVINQGLDYLENLPLVVDRKVENVQMLNADGNFYDVPFVIENEKCIVDTFVFTLEPVILIIS